MNRVQEYLFIIILGYSIIIRFLVNNLGRTEKEEMMEEISFSVRIFHLNLWIQINKNRKKNLLASAVNYPIVLPLYSIKITVSYRITSSRKHQLKNESAIVIIMSISLSIVDSF